MRKRLRSARQRRPGEPYAMASIGPLGYHSSSESLGGILPTLESSSESLRSYVLLVNSFGL
jgi:hypothetical protein